MGTAGNLIGLGVGLVVLDSVLRPRRYKRTCTTRKKKKRRYK